eukprot:1239330-Amphidinium_carterae.1
MLSSLGVAMARSATSSKCPLVAGGAKTNGSPGRKLPFAGLSAFGPITWDSAQVRCAKVASTRADFAAWLLVSPPPPRGSSNLMGKAKTRMEKLRYTRPLEEFGTKNQPMLPFK